MIDVDIRNDAREVRRVLAGYGRGTDRVLLRTLNRVMPSVKSRAAGEIARELGVPRSVANKALNIRRATARNLRTDMGADTKRIPLINFKARQPPPGVTYQIGNNPRRLLPRAFINVGRKVGRTVLKRAGQGDNLVPRDPALIKYGPSPAGVFIRETVQKLLDTTARERWVRELTAQIKFFLSKQG